MSAFEKYYAKAQELSVKLLNNPELGFKENITQKIILDEINSIDPNIKTERCLKTGIKISFDNNKNKTIGIIAEMDALYQPKHKKANSNTGAAHACGHYTQVVIALSMINEIVKGKRLQDFDTNIAFIFTPAEEFVDLDWRKRQKEIGKLTFFGGKQEAIKEGVFDDIDYCISFHAIGEEFSKRTVEINCDLAGFNFKYFDFYGKASHAAFAAEQGINAQSISALFTVALGLVRQQVKDPSKIRFNPVVIGDNTESINVIPDHVRMGCDLRYFDLDESVRLLNQFNNAAAGCAEALGGKAKITTQIGYLPLISNRDMNAIVKNVFLKDDSITEIIEDRGYTMAAGDIGDVSYMMPTIQIGYGGWHGTIHGYDFELVDPEFVLKIFPKFVFNSTVAISKNLSAIKTYRRSKGKYFEKLRNLGA